MTFMVSGKTGSGKSTAVIHMLKAYTDNKVFQKMILISPTAAYDEKYKLLPLTSVYEDYSDGLLQEIMEEQKEDIENYKETEANIKLYKKFVNSTTKTRFSKDELLRLYNMLDPQTGEILHAQIFMTDSWAFTAKQRLRSLLRTLTKDEEVKDESNTEKNHKEDTKFSHTNKIK